MHVGMEGIAYQRSCIKRYYEALREDLQLKNMSRKSYTALGSLNSIRSSACRFTWTQPFKSRLYGPCRSKPANDCAEQDGFSTLGSVGRNVLESISFAV
jgi:hypothetical protein